MVCFLCSDSAGVFLNVPNTVKRSTLIVTKKHSPQQRVAECSSFSDPPYPIVRRLSHRLDHLYQWALAGAGYDDVWDLCCDHGRLGLHLHQVLNEPAKNTPSHIHLVDCVPSIIESLAAKYASLLLNPYLTAHCVDAGDIALPSNGRQLVLIAGIGAGTMADILDKVIRHLDALSVPGAESDIEFMLSPNFNALELRRFLRQQPLELLKEEFVTDKGQHHEHLHLRYCPEVDASRKVTPVGSELWSPLTEEKQTYIEKLTAHYESCVRLGGDLSAQDALAAYRNLLNPRG